MAICLCKLLLMCESMKRSLRLAELTCPCIALAKQHITLHVSHGIGFVATHYSPVEQIDGDFLAIRPAGALATPYVIHAWTVTPLDGILLPG